MQNSQTQTRPAQSKNEQIKESINDFFLKISLTEAINEQNNLINTYVCPSDSGENDPIHLANTIFYSTNLTLLLTQLNKICNG